MGIEEIVVSLSQIDLLYVYAAVFFIAFIENIFPPFPSDVIVVFVGSLIAIGKGSVLITVALATLGSTVGFMTMYSIGYRFDHSLIEGGKIRWISRDVVEKVNAWFGKYGYAVIIVNRFLAGTRAIVSFCAGMASMKFVPTTMLSALSALVWNSILVFFGIAVGENWRVIGEYLTTYSTVVSIVIAVLILAGVIRYFIMRKKSKVS